MDFCLPQLPELHQHRMYEFAKFLSSRESAGECSVHCVSRDSLRELLRLSAVRRNSGITLSSLVSKVAAGRLPMVAICFNSLNRRWTGRHGPNGAAVP
jgi:hypothetical protein